MENVVSRMTVKEFQKFLDRDGCCYHCGISGDTLVPQHRAGRGMGGSKQRETPANVIVFCSLANGLIESDAVFAEQARLYGWKIGSTQDPAAVPVVDFATQTKWLLDSDYNRTSV